MNISELNLPPNVKELFSVFTDDEIQSLGAYFYGDEFIGIGFHNSDGVFTQYADSKRALAIAALEEIYRKELDRSKQSFQYIDQTIKDMLSKPRVEI